MSEPLGRQQWEALRELFHDRTEYAEHAIRAMFALAQAEGRAGELEGELLWAAREFNRLALMTTDGATYEAARQAVTRLRRFLATPPPELPQWLRAA